MANFKDRFKELRKEKGLAQKEIGDILGYSESTISLYESGRREPKNTEDFIKIADFFDVTLDYLLGRADNPEGIISAADIEGQHYQFELDKTIFPNGITREQMIDYIKELEKRNKQLEKNNEELKEEAELSRKMKKIIQESSE